MKHIKTYENAYTADDLMWCIEDIDMVKKILSSGVDPNSYGRRRYTAIQLVPYCSNNIKIFDLLLRFGANIDAINKSNGRTTLIDFSMRAYLSSTHDIRMLHHIISRDADWSITDDDGKDFMDAIYYNSSSMPRLTRIDKDKIIDNIIKRYPKKYEEYLIKKTANKYNL
jgi:hypothetical protein